MDKKTVIHRRAIISEDQIYRYLLWREWGAEQDRFQGYVLWALLNPSTADGHSDDPTIRRCYDYTEREGYHAMCVVNLFAFRATNPKAMKAAADPVGPENDQIVRLMAETASLIIVGWGTHGLHRRRDVDTLSLLPHEKIYCFGVNEDGTPMHPLFLRKDLALKPYFMLRRVKEERAA